MCRVFPSSGKRTANDEILEAQQKTDPLLDSTLRVFVLCRPPVEELGFRGLSVPAFAAGPYRGRQI